MVNIIDTAIELERLHVPENTLVDLDLLKNYPDEKTVIITTGSQGERLAALSRMANGTHRKISIGPKDTVVFSSHPIPGNEKAVTKIINELFRKGADVIFEDTHVSGHACQEEIKLIYSLTQPMYSIPVHGEFKHLMAQAKIAEQLGIEKENIFILRSGDVLEFKNRKAEVVAHVQAGSILVDGLGVGDVGNIVLRDRQKLSEDGIIIVVMAMESFSNQLVSGPDIVTRGFVYVKEADDMIEEMKLIVEDSIIEAQNRGVSDWNKYKNVVRDNLGEFVWKRTKRRPMILPVIMEIN